MSVCDISVHINYHDNSLCVVIALSSSHREQELHNIGHSNEAQLIKLHQHTGHGPRGDKQRREEGTALTREVILVCTLSLKSEQWVCGAVWTVCVFDVI